MERGECRKTDLFGKGRTRDNGLHQRKGFISYFNRQESYKNIEPINQAIERDLKK